MVLLDGVMVDSVIMDSFLSCSGSMIGALSVFLPPKVSRPEELRGTEVESSTTGSMTDSAIDSWIDFIEVEPWDSWMDLVDMEVFVIASSSFSNVDSSDNVV